MDSSRFDELTKALATSTSRRQALKAIAATTIGSILGLGGLGTALASNSACAHFCVAVFGADTPAANQCSSDAAHHKGLCYTCGPASPGGGVAPSAICCTRNSSNYCTSYNGATCCPSGQVCQSGTCVTPCTANGGTCSGNSDCCSGNCSNGICCASGQVGLSNGTCATPCSSPEQCCTSCCPDPSGGSYCCDNGTATPCTTDNDCPTGQFCELVSPQSFCVTVC